MNDVIDRTAQLRIRRSASVASTDEITERLEHLNHEWDFDRVLGAEAALMGLATLGLAVTLDRRLIALPAVVASMVSLHGVQGWCPLLPIFRRVGIRTQNEIDKERSALKALRGDLEETR